MGAFEDSIEAVREAVQASRIDDVRSALMRPYILRIVARELGWQQFVNLPIPSTIVGVGAGGGMIMGAILDRYHKTGAYVYSRSQPEKEHGTQARFGGDLSRANLNRPVMIVDDVCTTGSSLAYAAEAVLRHLDDVAGTDTTFPRPTLIASVVLMREDATEALKRCGFSHVSSMFTPETLE